MLVVRIVDMRVFVFQEKVSVLMRVMFCEMEPDACRHEETSKQQGCRQWRTERHGESSTDKGSQREIGAGSRGPQIAQRQDEKRQAESIACEAEHT